MIPFNKIDASNPDPIDASMITRSTGKGKKSTTIRVTKNDEITVCFSESAMLKHGFSSGDFVQIQHYTGEHGNPFVFGLKKCEKGSPRSFQLRKDVKNSDRFVNTTTVLNNYPQSFVDELYSVRKNAESDVKNVNRNKIRASTTLREKLDKETLMLGLPNA